MSSLLRAARSEQGATLIEFLVATSLLMIVVVPTFLGLEFLTRTQNRDQQWGFAIREGQTSLATMMHEIRNADRVLAASPSSIDFTVSANGQRQHVGYFCNVVQAGTAYYQCVRVQAPAVTASLPAPATGSPVILRVTNGGLNSYCNLDGTYSSAVFHYANRTNPNNGATCAPAAQGAAAIAPTVVQAVVNLPASGEAAASQRAGLTHTITLSSGSYLRNLDLGS